jgi:DNA-binding protein HU-beta
MNKTELIGSLSAETELPKDHIKRVLDALLRNIVRELRKDGKVQWSGFGTFVVARRPARMGINPATKARIRLPETHVPKFKPGKNLKELIRLVK